jgi:hypothetical protein
LALTLAAFSVHYSIGTAQLLVIYATQFDPLADL